MAADNSSSDRLANLLDQFRSIVLEAKENIKLVEKHPKPSLACYTKLKDQECQLDLQLKRRQSPYKSIKKLPSNWQSTVTQIINNPSEQEDCITSVGNCQIGHAELVRLQDGNWLNDQIIDGYMWLINERSRRELELNSLFQPKVHSFNCYLYLKMMQNEFNSVSNHTKRWNINIFEKDLLLFPISLGNHWTLGAVEINNKQVKYFDSLGGREGKFFKSMKIFLQNETNSRKCVGEIDWNEWKFEVVKSIPKQHNSYDCGVFVCIYAEYLAKGIEFDFTQRDMKLFRQRIKYELLTGKLLEDDEIED